MSDFEIIDENLRTAMRFFGRATGAGEVVTLPGMEAIYSGLNYGVFNIAMLTGQPQRERGLELCAAEAARYFKTRSPRWSFWLCEDWLDTATRRRAREVLADFGLRAISHPPGMIAHTLQPPVKRLPTIEIHRVATDADRRAFAEVTSISFEIPYSIATSVYTPEPAWRGEYQGVLAVAEGRVVAITATVAAAGVIGIYSLATHPNYRRLGYAEALLRGAVDLARKETGFEKVVLQSTESGYLLYRRMGFRDSTRFSVYLTK
ncbi:MAG: GNAT family N-acetyltransferase [Bryobacteraceae bacterium]